MNILKLAVAFIIWKAGDGRFQFFHFKSDVRLFQFGRRLFFIFQPTCPGTVILPVVRNSSNATTEFDREFRNGNVAVLLQTIVVLFLSPTLPRLRHDVGATFYQRSKNNSVPLSKWSLRLVSRFACLR